MFNISDSCSEFWHMKKGMIDDDDDGRADPDDDADSVV